MAAPAGAEVARVAYAIQSFSTAPLGDGTVYVDDLSFAVVPEPTTTGLAGLGGATLLTVRRRRDWNGCQIEFPERNRIPLTRPVGHPLPN